MKKFIIIFALIPLLFGCSTKDRSAQNIALVEKYIQSVENLDYQLMGSLLSEDYYGYGPSYGDSIGKEDAIINWRYNVENLYKSVDYSKSRNAAITIENGDNKGEWVSNWGELDIVYKENNKKIKIWANTIYRIEGDKIVKSYTFYNEADVLKQLGFVFVDINHL